MAVDLQQYTHVLATLSDVLELEAHPVMLLALLATTSTKPKPLSLHDGITWTPAAYTASTACLT